MPAAKKPTKKKAAKKPTMAGKKKLATKKPATKKTPAVKKPSAVKKIATKKAAKASKKPAPTKQSKTSVKPAEITISGDMYECNWIEITPDQFRLLRDANEEGGIEDLFEEDYELHDNIFGDSVINGFTFEPEYANFQVHVDDVSQSALVGEFLKRNQDAKKSNAPLKSTGKAKSYYLIFEKWCRRGVYSAVINEKFDPVQLELSVEDCVLPNGTVSQVANLSYEGYDFEFGDSWTSSQELYIYCTDGSVIKLDY